MVHGAVLTSPSTCTSDIVLSGEINELYAPEGLTRITTLSWSTGDTSGTRVSIKYNSTAHLTYAISCSKWNKWYIGETFKQAFNLRINLNRSNWKRLRSTRSPEAEHLKSRICTCTCTLRLYWTNNSKHNNYIQIIWQKHLMEIDINNKHKSIQKLAFLQTSLEWTN